MPWIIVAVFALVALIMGAVAALSTAGAGRAVTRQASAPGEVVDIVSRTGASGQALYSPVVEFYLPDETLERVRLSEESLIPAYALGQQVTVLYDRRQPENARVKHGESAAVDVWILPIISGILAVAFVGATLLAVWMLGPELRGR
jgi:hypothetical protein